MPLKRSGECWLCSAFNFLYVMIVVVVVVVVVVLENRKDDDPVSTTSTTAPSLQQPTVMDLPLTPVPSSAPIQPRPAPMNPPPAAPTNPPPDKTNSPPAPTTPLPGSSNPHPASTKRPVRYNHTSIPLERLVDLFSELSPETAQDLLDEQSPQYVAMQWLTLDAAQNSWTLFDPKVIQRALLAVLYFSLGGGEKWTNATGWLEPSMDECSWFGVFCSKSHEIKSLFLPSNNLIGQLPRELGFMESLKNIILYGNAIQGNIPPTLGRLTFLSTFVGFETSVVNVHAFLIDLLVFVEHLLLDNNDLTGTLPSTIGLLTSLGKTIRSAFIFVGVHAHVFCPV